MKSNKQRRAEIKRLRLERAASLATDNAARDVGALIALMASGQRVPGMAPADNGILSRDNEGRVRLPYYQDRAFTCHDCGAESVWTAKQQKWWYEKMHGPIDSEAVRCLTCRRARRAALAAAMAHEGANLLREQTDRLRALGDKAPTAEALAEVDAALQGKWWGLRVIAIETLGRWGGPRQIAQLQTLAAAHAGRTHRRGTWERIAADAAAKALRREDQS